MIITKPYIDFTGQHINDAVVPLLVGELGSRWHAPELNQDDWTSLRRPDGEAKNDQDWGAVWGLYRHGSTVYEASGLVQLHMHNFCGGGVLSSFNIRTTYAADVVRYPRLTHTGSLWGTHQGPIDWIPDITHAVHPEFHRFLGAHVTSILRRSLAAWAMSWLFSHSKVSAVLFDVEDGQLSQIFAETNTVPFVCPQVFLTNINDTSPLAIRELANDEKMVLNFMSIGWRRATACAEALPRIVTTTKFHNDNSGHTCLMQHLLCDNERPRSPHTVYESFTDSQAPDWFMSKAQTVRYVRMFPREKFYN